MARRFRVSLHTVQRWVKRAQGKRLDRVDWHDGPPGPKQAAHRTPPAIEALLLKRRQVLQEKSDLGEFGALAVQQSLKQEGVEELPSVRTIGRIFVRRGLLDGRERIRHKAPPPGWYLPEVAARLCELDQVDTTEGLKIKDGPLVEVLNLVSLYGGLVGSFPRQASLTTPIIVEALIAHWQEWGLPGYAQFDNDTLFQGPHQHPDAIGRVIRLCLSLEIIPVFVPPREMGFHASIEHYNGQWQAKVWTRFEHTSLAALQQQSDRYVKAHRLRSAPRRESAPPRQPFPQDWRLDLQAPARGQIVFIRRTNPQGEASLLGHVFPVDSQWAGRLVRGEVLLDDGCIRFYQLRRRAPKEQPLLHEVPYRWPHKPFRE